MFRHTWILNYWINSSGLCSAVDRITIMALLALKLIDRITSYKIVWYFLCWIAKDRRLQLQIKYLNKYLKVLRRFLFILSGSTGQSGFLRNFRKLMKGAKCIGKNLILHIINGLPVRIIHPRVAWLPGTRLVHWCVGLTRTEVNTS